MLSSFWMTAPAGSCGRGSVAVRPSLLAAVPVVQGSGLPFASMAPRHRDQVVDRIGFGTALLQKTTTNDPITQNDGTTLGNHPSGRPRS